MAKTQEELKQAAAEYKVNQKFQKLKDNLYDFLTALQKADDANVMLDNIEISQKTEGGYQLRYKASPIKLIIDLQDRKFEITVIPKNVSDTKSRT